MLTLAVICVSGSFLIWGAHCDYLSLCSFSSEHPAGLRAGLQFFCFLFRSRNSTNVEGTNPALIIHR